jgi:hypothetical protein
MPYAQKVVTSGLGEGLLHKDVASIVDGASRYGVAIFTNTNGTTLLPKIVGGMFGISEMRLSLDGATPAAFEALRLGAKYDKVMRNVLVVTRANERLPPALRLHPTVNFGITASNVREMPVMVDLCAYLGLEAVHGFRMVPLNPKYAEDDIEKYPAAYKHYYLQAMQRARARNMVVTLPAPDPNAEPDATARPTDTGMIVTGLDDAYYQHLPDFGRLIDGTDLEPEVDAMMAAALEAGIARHGAARPSAVREATERAGRLDAEMAAEIQRGFQAMSAEQRARLASMHKSERTVADCIFLQAHLIYNASGTVSPCCDSTIEIAHNTDDPREILRNGPLQTLVGEFVTGNFRKNCAGCSMRQTIPERGLFPVPIP